MAKQGENNLRLGVFALSGLIILILSFYMIGKNHNLFGSSFELKARFTNLNGLIEGNNVLFSGIQAGTVKEINLLNDTTIEVTLLIDNKIRQFIKKNALVSIGTEGLMGNKIINISPGKARSSPVAFDDLLQAKKMFNTDEILETLSKTGDNIADISGALKTTVARINNSSLLKLLNDKNIGSSINLSLNNIEKASANASEITSGISTLVGQTKHGKNGVGVLLADTAFAGSLKMTAFKIKSASENANQLIVSLNTILNNVGTEINSGNGAIHVLLKDSATAQNLRLTLSNIQKGTDNFNQDMEALKHNLLLSGYFKRLARKQKKQADTGKTSPVVK